MRILSTSGDRYDARRFYEVRLEFFCMNEVNDVNNIINEQIFIIRILSVYHGT